MQSESNVQHILISDPKDGVTSYGLTEEGKKQAKQVHISDNNNNNNNLCTVVSRVSAHGRSTITPYFSLPWALTWCTGHLPCAKNYAQN